MDVSDENVAPSGHRGPHPDDAGLFSPKKVPALREAVSDVSWLLTRGYTDLASVKVVGDRWGLTARQRQAVTRASCSDSALAERKKRRIAGIAGLDVAVDGFNALLPVERALGGGPVFSGREGAIRDLGGVHGTWRVVAETEPGLRRLGRVLAPAKSVRWILDSPISNSGRLAELIRNIAAQDGLPWEVETLPKADPALIASGLPVGSSDAWILENAASWFDLAGEAIRSLEGPWLVSLG